MSIATATLGPEYSLPSEEPPLNGRRSESYAELLARLSHQSVIKHFDAYADIPWDGEEFRIDPNNSCWELPDLDPLGASAWYRAQPAEMRARIGLHHYATLMKIGLQFESVLKRGLLEFAAELPNGAPEFRYVYHEVIEEAQHALMFQEFVNRTGLEVRGMPPAMLRAGARHVVRLGRRFPELFFMFVLGGEDPIDHVQRTLLGSGQPLHPLFERIMKIHVTEEARHLCFARHYLRRNVPQLPPHRRFLLALRVPLLLRQMAALMLRPSGDIVRQYGIPKAVIVEAYRRNPQHRAAIVQSLRKVRQLCAELGLITPLSLRLWKRLGIWDSVELPR
jgi:hypothetical protein